MAELKQKCTYWDNCYRKDPAHKKQFIHPGDPEAATTAKASPSKTPLIDLNGKKVVFTGTLSGCTRKEAEAKAIKAGCIVTKAVSSKTDYLVCGEDAGGKVTYAENLGIEVLSQDEWDELLKKASGDSNSEKDSDTDEEVIAPKAAAATPTSTKAKASPSKTPQINLKGKKVVFTGTLSGCSRKEAEAKAIKAGCLVTKAVSSKTDYLVCGEDAGGKVTNAENLGIEVLSQDEWDDLLKTSSGDSNTENGDDTDEEVDMDTSEPTESGDKKKAKLKRNRTHEMSDDEDDAAPKASLVRRRSQRLSDKDAKENKSLKPPPAKKARTETPVAGPSRPKCRYYEKCYRKDPNHLKSFRHPPKAGTSAAAEAGGGDGEEDMDAEDEDCAPLHDMADKEEVHVPGGLHGAKMFRLQRIGDYYTCTCTGWIMQKSPTDLRTCRHLRGYLGEEFENKRVAFDPAVKPTPSRTLKHKAVAVLLAHKYTEGVNPKGWWLSEKLDGVRAFWDGKCFYSRLGNEFLPPKWFIKGLPTDMCLDGELFGGRGKFQSTVSIVKTPESSRWKDIKYCVFDAPSVKKPFEARLKAINTHFKENEVPYAYGLEHEICRGKDHAYEELKRIEGLGGEGVMLREPGSKYVGSRSHTLLKLKSFHDAEAVVIGHEKGKGRNAAVCGALVCRMACGTQFKVGSGLSDKERRSPPKKGSIITYRFQELTNGGHPRFPTFVGVRIDLDKPCDAVIPPKATDG